MGKYAISKFSIILYHKRMKLSIGFAKVFEKLCKSPSLMSEGLESLLSDTEETLEEFK